MEGMRFIQTIRLENILSFGPNAFELPLEPLNVFIGPNASGKSNLIEALSILQAAPRDIQTPIREGGGIRDWLWKGAPKTPTATVDVTVEYPRSVMPLRHRISFTETGGRFELRDEAVENVKPATSAATPFFFYRYQNGDPVLSFMRETRSERRLMREEVKHDQSILSQRRDPDSYPELTYLANQFDSIKFYREWNLGRFAAARLPQQLDLPQDSLLEDASNLGVVLSDLKNRLDVMGVILERLRNFYPSVEDVVPNIIGGTVQVFFHEKGLRLPVPATRLSDGSLHYLCLLVVLCHPTPPPVICIEEPEMGLHPDVISDVARLLVEASARCQLFVTTHSDILVDALTDVPETVVVCEKSDGATQLRRLDAEELKPWLEEYRLGEIWTRGAVGGNRW